MIILAQLFDFLMIFDDFLMIIRSQLFVIV